MERVEGPQTPFEVYCYHCKVTHPAGTRRCVHCGGPVGPRGAAKMLTGPGPAGEVEVEDPTELPTGRRLATMSLWMLLALGAAAYRVCAGG